MIGEKRNEGRIKRWIRREKKLEKRKKEDNYKADGGQEDLGKTPIGESRNMDWNKNIWRSAAKQEMSDNHSAILNPAGRFTWGKKNEEHLTRKHKNL